jgi:hypothetical protein
MWLVPKRIIARQPVQSCEADPEDGRGVAKKLAMVMKRFVRRTDPLSLSLQK